MTLFQHRSRARRNKKRAVEVNEFLENMRIIQHDGELILMYHRGAWTPTAVQSVMGLYQIWEAYEIWVYNPIDRKFLAYKNKGACELVERLAKSGIKVKTTAAKIPTAAAQQLAFVADEDHFLFKLKYGL